jgi:Leucine-rich repeat (LRR) protein
LAKQRSSDKYKFIRDDIQLCPWIDQTWGDLGFFIQKINLNTNEIMDEEEIICYVTEESRTSKKLKDLMENYYDFNDIYPEFNDFLIYVSEMGADIFKPEIILKYPVKTELMFFYIRVEPEILKNKEFRAKIFRYREIWQELKHDDQNNHESLKINDLKNVDKLDYGSFEIKSGRIAVLNNRAGQIPYYSPLINIPALNGKWISHIMIEGENCVSLIAGHEQHIKKKKKPSNWRILTKKISGADFKYGIFDTDAYLKGIFYDWFYVKGIWENNAVLSVSSSTNCYLSVYLNEDYLVVMAWLDFNSREIFSDFIQGIKFENKPIELKEDSLESSLVAFLSENEKEIIMELIEICNQKIPKFELEDGKIVKLNIDYEFLMHLPESIGNLKHIRRLNITNTLLKSLPESIGNLNSLKRLNIYTNQLKTLPESIGNLKNLEWLTAGVNFLEVLPETIGNLESLEYLSLYENRLVNLPQSIGNLKTLKNLILHDNRLKILPLNIGNLKSLKDLSLNNNQLKSLPKSIGDIKSLKELSLNNNQLKNLPDSLFELKFLKELNVGKNNLTEIQKSITNLTLLKELHLDGNKLKNLPENFDELKSIRILYINNNLLQSLPDRLCNCLSLNRIHASNNQLITLPKNIGLLSKLWELDLSENNIKFIPESIGKITGLQDLDLSGNPLEDLPKSIYNLTEFQNLRLPFNLDTKEFRDWIDSQRLEAHIVY